MIIQVPGAFLFAFSLWLRVGWGGWSTWLVYVVTGILQAILLTLAITYFFAGRKAARERETVDAGLEGDEDGAEQTADERTALMANGHDATKPIYDTQRAE